jgi:hypothetical protein
VGLATLDLEGLADALANLARADEDVVRRAQVDREHREDVRADARDRVYFAHQAGDTLATSFSSESPAAWP